MVYLVTSPEAEGLFQRALPQSGSSVEAPWMTGRARQNLNILAAALSNFQINPVVCLKSDIVIFDNYS